MIRKAAFQLKTEALGRQSLRVYHEFIAADKSPSDQLDELSRNRSIAHARFAMSHSPFYRDLYTAHGFTLADLDDPDAFTSLPFVEKHDLREQFADIRTDEATDRTSAVSRTGGSTGLPLHVLRDLRFPARALEWRLFQWWGIQPWDDRGIITRHMLTGSAKLRHDLAWLPSRRIQLDAFQINDATVEKFVREWNRAKPPFLLGYGGGVLDMARRLERLELSVHQPRAVAVTAAPLTDGVRKEIQDVLGAPCYDHYRSAEVPWIAGECSERDGQHVFSDVRRVEILGEDGVHVPAGTEGDVVVSDLTNRVFPVIRYRLGDISSFRPGACSCGRALPRLGPISGRRSDAIRLPDGTTIAGALGHIFDDSPLAVRQFEIVQSIDYAVTLRCIPGATHEAMDEIRVAEQKLRGAVRGLVPVSLEIVNDIPQVGGKMRFIRSDAPLSPVAAGQVQTPARSTLKVVIAIPTYRRPEKLRRLLTSLPERIAEIETEASVSVLVVDNDPLASAAQTAADLAATLLVRSVVEKTPGIAAARNRAIDESNGADLLAFIDDDELPLQNWLNALIETWRTTRPAAVMGRVISVFDEDVDPWLLATGVFSRRERPTGLSLTVAAAGNLLLDLAQVRQSGVRFDASLGLAGGEDTLFSRQLVASGLRILWCNESMAEDFVPHERLTRSWAMRRAFNGGNSAIHIELALKPRLDHRVATRVKGVFGGIARMAAGWLAHGWGRIGGGIRADARGLRTFHRGRGMVSASFGYRHREYART